jgi:spermidine/putrescine transport system substrate-binding protein
MWRIGWFLMLLCTSSHAVDELHLYNWNNYISDATISRFEAQCRCRVVQDYYSDNEEMLAKLAAGATGYDIMVPTGNAVESLIRQRALRPLDKRLLPNFGNIESAYLNNAFDPGVNGFQFPFKSGVDCLSFKFPGLPRRLLFTSFRSN